MRTWFLVFLEDELIWKVQSPNEETAERKFIMTFGATMAHDHHRWIDKTIRLMSLHEYEEMKHREDFI